MFLRSCQPTRAATEAFITRALDGVPLTEWQVLRHEEYCKVAPSSGPPPEALYDFSRDLSSPKHTPSLVGNAWRDFEPPPKKLFSAPPPPPQLSPLLLLGYKPPASIFNELRPPLPFPRTQHSKMRKYLKHPPRMVHNPQIGEML